VFDRKYFEKGKGSNYKSYKDKNIVMKKVYFPKVFEDMKITKGLKVLDIGCAYGYFLKLCEERGYETYGIDISKYAITQAKREAKRTKLFVHDIEKGLHMFKDNFFDIVVANQIVEHLFNPDNFFLEIYRVLKPGGYAVIATPNLCSLHNRLFVLLGWQITNISPSTKFVFGNPNRGAISNMSGPYRHLTVFSPPALKEMCEFYGLKVEKIAGAGFYPFTSNIAKFLSKIFPTFSVYLIAKVKKVI